MRDESESSSLSVLQHIGSRDAVSLVSPWASIRWNQHCSQTSVGELFSGLRRKQRGEGERGREGEREREREGERERGERIKD